MAFSTATGYGNLPNGNFSPIIYSKQVQVAFRKASIVEAITNSDYFGEIANMGDSVKVIKEPEITVKEYARGTTITPQDLDDEEFSLTIDKQTTLHLKSMILKKLIRTLTSSNLQVIVQLTDYLISMTKTYLVIYLVLNSQHYIVLLTLLTLQLTVQKQYQLLVLMNYYLP